MKPHVINQNLSGIAAWYTDESLCDRLIELFEENIKNTHVGLLGDNEIDPGRKDSIDLDFTRYLNKYPEFHEYLTLLRQAVDEYKKIYPYCDYEHGAWGITENFNLQKYNPGGGFKSYHTERQGGPTVKRHLVFMTYLNTVTDQGETEWLYQNLKVKPEKGLTVIWSADWYFTHRGIPSPTQTKYIVTGWYSYLSSE